MRFSNQSGMRQFVRPARIKGVIFFLDDLDNFADPRAQGMALALRNQFQEFRHTRSQLQPLLALAHGSLVDVSFRPRASNRNRLFNSEQPGHLFARDAGYRTFAQPARARTPYHRLVFGQQPR